MLSENKHDLTERPIYKKLILFFLPIFAGNVFQQLYVTVDAIVIGRFAGLYRVAHIHSLWCRRDCTGVLLIYVRRLKVG